MVSSRWCPELPAGERRPLTHELATALVPGMPDPSHDARQRLLRLWQPATPRRAARHTRPRTAEHLRVSDRRNARLWLWETLTGALPRHAPPALRLATPEFLPDHHRFALGLPAETVNRLNQHARHPLDTHGFANEPITWTPSAKGIAKGIAIGSPTRHRPTHDRPRSRPRRHRRPAHPPARSQPARHHDPAPSLHRSQPPTRAPRPNSSDRARARPIRRPSRTTTAPAAPRPRQITATDRGLPRNRATHTPPRTRRTQPPCPAEEPSPVDPPAPANRLSIYPRTRQPREAADCPSMTSSSVDLRSILSRTRMFLRTCLADGGGCRDHGSRRQALERRVGAA